MHLSAGGVFEQQTLYQMADFQEGLGSRIFLGIVWLAGWLAGWGTKNARARAPRFTRVSGAAKNAEAPIYT